MGVVYMAEQMHPVKRRVALKIIKPGMDSKQVLARFEAERQALAMMDHPNIAKVFEAGTTESGCPYFVMELVKGVPITGFCDEQKLSTRERLQLFVTVCQAVQHAHQKGIIHRDLKPSNVLIAKFDDKPVAKVIDFGVAKAMNQELTERTMFTQFGQIVGTLEYMSPEQAQFNQLDIDTRSDVYSLGVLLYELLVGSPPFDRDRLRTAALDEVMRIIRDEQPPKPSARLSTLGAKAATVSSNRNSTNSVLGKSIRGDIDLIVMKALEKDRTRRYETASGFAADLKRFLDGETVHARPASTWYRARMTIARNRGAFAAATVIMLGCLIGLTGAIVGLSRAAAEIQAKNQILAQLRETMTGEALNLALVGDYANAIERIDALKQTEADPSLCLALRGMAHLYSLKDGHNAEAIRLFEEALKHDRNSIPATTGMWLAVDQLGEYDKMSSLRRRINNLRPRANSDIDRFFLTQTTRHIEPKATHEQLERLLRKHRFWAAAYAFRGRTQAQLAKLNYADAATVVAFEVAIDDFDVASKLAPESVFVASDYLLALVEAVEFARFHSLSSKEAEWMSKASQLYASLPSTDHRFGYAFRSRTMYLALTGDWAAIDAIRSSMPNQEKPPRWILAAFWFADKQYDEFERFVDSRPDDPTKLDDALRAIYDVDVTHDVDAVASASEAIFDSDSVATGVDGVAVTTHLLLGRPDETARIAKKLLSMESLLDDPWYTLILEYIASPSDENEAKLLRLAGPFQYDRMWAYFAVGMEALANGDRSKARACFDEVLRTGILDGYFVWAYAFKRRIEADPAWPSWIPANKELVSSSR
ncbi:MAG: protein kinase, partial [Planctomycetales bacterium]|nr:protein kinase [Planctomycetales bacterium]